MSKEKSGILRISEDVVITITESAVNEIKGVEKIRRKSGFIRDLLIKDKPIEVKITGDVIEVNVDIVIKGGYNAASVGEKVQEAVKSEIQAMTGITVSRVNVTISGICFDVR